ncbi:hypothetical protein NPIL_411511 [Nephila pilipes]|uniref:Uncharacterized protein n=1 Tax=Nephila pilipes TaxID=299642 RepID=A0A8X6IKF8_NEPPI|nr:hypothetical protein NPIL_411511 [Nephila pilipes]
MSPVGRYASPAWQPSFGNAERERISQQCRSRIPFDQRCYGSCRACAPASGDGYAQRERVLHNLDLYENESFYLRSNLEMMIEVELMFKVASIKFLMCENTVFSKRLSHIVLYLSLHTLIHQVDAEKCLIERRFQNANIVACDTVASNKLKNVFCRESELALFLIPMLGLRY